ncbi:MAG: hypothetical protein HZB43_08975, partial [candidate division Zixibacteria bacterium]|nr:hypothetical protein [candidate division Zixibacteria bacterium]
KDHQVFVRVDHSKFQGSIDKERSLVLFRSVKELLTNAVHHSCCHTISVVLFSSECNLVIRVNDDGHGFDVDHALHSLSATGKFGLFSVRERMRLLGGDMNLKSDPAQGTQIELRIPSPLTSVGHE